MTDQTATIRHKTLHEILNMTPDERRQRAEALAAMFARWEEEGDPDGTTDEEWAELIERLENPKLTFRSSFNE